jgi:hypothetical protein
MSIPVPEPLPSIWPIIKATKTLVPVVTLRHGSGGRGGRLCITDPNGYTQVDMDIGTPPDHMDTSAEQAAILVNETGHIVSFAGLPPDVGAAFILAVLRYLDVIDKQQEVKIVSRTLNWEIYFTVRCTVYTTLTAEKSS